MFKKSIILNCIFIICLFTFDQTFSQTIWTKTYGGSGADNAYSVQQTSDEGYIISGYTASFGAGSADIWLIKTNANGDTLWTKTFGGSGSDAAYSVQETNDGGYIIAGNTSSFGTGGAWLIKTNALGDTLWTKTFGGIAGNASSIQQMMDDGYIFTGGLFSLIKTNASGDTLWTKTYGSASGDISNLVRQTSDGGYIITGSTKSLGAGSNDIWLLKTDANGDTLWSRTYGGLYRDFGYYVQQTMDGGYILLGYTESFGTGNYDFWLIKLDSIGNTQWDKTFGGYNSDVGYYAQQTMDGGYILTGYTFSFGAGRSDLWLIKTNESGDTLWTKTFGGMEADIGLSVQQTMDGGYVLAGYTNSFGAVNSDVLLIKTDSLGNTILPKSPDFVTIDIGMVHNFVSNSTTTYVDQQTFLIGRYDLSRPSMMWLEGGYPVNNYLYFGTFRIGYNNDFIRFSSLTSNDWTVYKNAPGQISPFDVHYSMTDSLADNLKVGIKCLCKVHAWSDPLCDDFFIYEYFIINKSGSTLTDVYAGFHIDGDISSISGGTGEFSFSRDDMTDYYVGADMNNHSESISYMYDGDNPFIPEDDTGGRLSPKESLGFLGSRVLECPASKNGIPENQQSGHQWWDWNNDPKLGGDWYNLISSQQFKENSTVPYDYRYFQTMGPWDMAPDETLHIALAFGLGEGLNGLRENLQTAYDFYWTGILPIQTCTEPDSDIVSWWPGEDNGQDILARNNGVLQNGVGFAPGHVGRALSFDGSDDYVEVSDATSLAVTSVTVEAWIKPNVTNKFQRIISNGSTYDLFIDDTGQLRFIVSPQSFVQGTSVDVGSGGYINAGVWSHVAGTYDEYTGTGKIYLNGVQKISNDFADSNPLISHQNKVFIGNYYLLNSCFDGIIDEVSVYKRSLTSKEIQSIYVADSLGKCSPPPVDVKELSNVIPYSFALKPNYPNPFNPNTTIEFSLPKTEWVTLTVFNILGQKVASLVSEKLNPGIHKYEWQVENLPSGIYYCWMQAGEFEQVRKMVLLR